MLVDAMKQHLEEKILIPIRRKLTHPLSDLLFSLSLSVEMKNAGNGTFETLDLKSSVRACS